MPSKLQRTNFTWLAYLMLSIYSYFLNILGPVTPFLKDELGLSYTVSSLHFTAFAAGILAVGLSGHRIVERFGRIRTLWLGSLGMSLMTLILIAGRSAWITVPAAFVMSCLGSLILIVIPATLSDQHGEHGTVAISEANVIASAVSAVAPLLVGWFALTLFGWRAALLIAALVPFGLLLIFRNTRLAEDQPEISQAAGSHRPLPRVYWLYWAGIVLVVSVEFCMVYWSADYFEKVLGLVKAEAALAVSLFLGAMIAGRFAGSRLLARFTARSLITVSILLTMVGFALFWLAGSPVFGMLGLFLTGLGVACLYPFILSLAIASANGESVQAGGRASLASGLAIMFLPLLLGRLADALGIHTAYGIVWILLLAALGLNWGIKNQTTNPENAGAGSCSAKTLL